MTKMFTSFVRVMLGIDKSLHSVLTSSGGESLCAAIEMSSNDKMRVKLSSAIDPSDAHAIDINIMESVGLIM